MDINKIKKSGKIGLADALVEIEKNPFDRKMHKKYLTHEKIENLAGLEVEFVYEWELGSMLIFDRTHLHCSSSKIEGAKIGLTTFTKK